MVHCRSTLSAFCPRAKSAHEMAGEIWLMPSVNASSASVVQECLTNIHRHSGSKTALIRIEREENTVRVMVEDQGNGMSPQRLAEIQSCGTGVRIRGMRERVRHFHGDLVIESDGSGTRVHAILPLTTPDSTYQSETQLEVARVTCRDELQFKNLGCLPGPSILTNQTDLHAQSRLSAVHSSGCGIQHFLKGRHKMRHI